MATIVFTDPADEFAGSIRGLTFDKSQAGPYVKRRPAPVNHQTNKREKTWALIRTANTYFWAMTNAQKTAWSNWAAANSIGGPWGSTGHQRGYAGFFTVQLNASIAGDPLYIPPPGNLPLIGVTFTSLTRISDTITRADFNPSPAGTNNRVFLRQALPGPGVKRWAKGDGYIAQISGLNPTSPIFFLNHFPLRPTWHGRYWTGTQENTGRRSAEDLWDL